jgi:hypothetical protein
MTIFALYPPIIQKNQETGMRERRAAGGRKQPPSTRRETITMIKISKIIYSGGACPYQLEANTEDGNWLYIRYRNGMLRYVVAKHPHNG